MLRILIKRLLVCVMVLLSWSVMPAEASSPPTATAGAEYVDVSGAAGATFRLYLTNGSLQATGVANASGDYRFENVLPNAAYYYVTQDDGSGESSNTSFFNVTLRTPTATPGTELVDVSNVSASATIQLYLTNGTLVSDTPSAQGGGVYRFSAVAPNSISYYVVQVVNGSTSSNSPFFNVALRTPSIVAGVRQVDVSNVYPGAVVTLKSWDGTVISTTPTDIGGGIYRFSNVTPDSNGHYVEQSINGVISAASNVAVVTATAPTFVGGQSTLTVNPGGTSIRHQLAVSDIDVNQTLTWTVTTAPTHGTLTGFPATASTNCANSVCGTAGSQVSLPATDLSYTPTAGYVGTDTFTVQVSDGVASTSRTFTIGVNAATGSTVDPADSAALSAAINDPTVSTIRLVNGVTYQIFGSEINRPLTIQGNGAIIEALGGIGQSYDDQTIFHLGMPDASNNRRYRGNLFWLVSTGGQLVASNLTVRNAASTTNAQGLTGIFGAILLTGASQASLNGIVFENFWFTNSQFMAQNNLGTAQGLYASYSDMSYGVYADYDFQGSLSVTGSTFGSSNAFRDAVHLYNSQSASITNNTFNGTAHADRLRSSDGFENGIYIYGGQNTITGNTISGYQAHLINTYTSAGITSVGFFAGGNATITGNVITNCSTNVSMAGGWQSFRPGSELSVNGYSLISNPGLAGFSLGNSNTLGAGVHGPALTIVKDQDDTALAYSAPLLVFNARTPTTASLGLASGTVPAINSTAFLVEQSTDGTTWSSATVTPSGTLNSANTSFSVSGLDPAVRYFFRLNDSDSQSNYVGWSNLIGLPVLTLSSVAETTATVGFGAPGTTGVRIEQSSDGGAHWATAQLQSAITATSTTATVTGLSASSSYLLRLNGAGTSGWGYSAPLSVGTSSGATCGTANQTATVFAPSGAGLCQVGTASAVIAGSPWTWTCTTADSTALCSAPNSTTATDSGSGRLVLTGSSGGTAWQVRSASFVSVASTAGSPPSGYSFPHGLLDLQLDTGSAGTSATVTITYPTALPANAVYWKFGRTAANPVAHWYEFPGAVISGNTVTLTLTDGGLGDNDLTANSVIVDPGGPGVPGGAGVSAVPTLSQWAQMVLSALVAALGILGGRWAQSRRRTTA